MKKLEIDIKQYNEIRDSIDNTLKYCNHTIWTQSGIRSLKKDIDVV